MHTPEKFRLKPIYFVLDIIGVALIIIGYGMLVRGDRIPEALRLEEYGMVPIIAGIALMSVPAFAFLRHQRECPPQNQPSPRD